MFHLDDLIIRMYRVAKVHDLPTNHRESVRSINTRTLDNSTLEMYLRYVVSTQNRTDEDTRTETKDDPDEKARDAGYDSDRPQYL